MLDLTLCVYVLGVGEILLFGYWGKSLRVSVGRARGWVFVISLYLGRGHRMQR